MGFSTSTRTDCYFPGYRTPAVSSPPEFYLTIEPGTMRGDQELTQSLQGHDKVHLCRHESCSEDGPHFKQYATVKAFQPRDLPAERSLYWCTSGGKSVVRLGFDVVHPRPLRGLRIWRRSQNLKFVNAMLIKSDGRADQGHQVLSEGICREVGVDVRLLDEDVPSSLGTVTLCPKTCL